MHSRFSLLILLLLFLTGCAETELASHISKSVPMPGDNRSEGLFKVGKPYEVDGKLYTPREMYRYTETGIASWYGPGFHGESTANGERFDENELTAAHRTLQMPSLVRVTNLENGRSLVVRVNDRGPFKRGRVIDVSKRAAELLGFRGRGTAKVKLELLAEESRAIAMAARAGKDTRGIEVALNENRATINTPYEPAPIKGHMGKTGQFYPDPVVQQYPVTPTNIYVQTGSFTNQDNAIRLAQNLQNLGQTKVYPAMVNGRQFYRVRLGPLRDVQEADTLLSRLASAGHREAITVVD